MKRNNKNGKIVAKNVVVLFIILSIIGICMTFSSAKEEQILKQYVVCQNDTLWNISAKICKNSESRELNVQSVVKEIKKINNLEDSSIYVGQTINIPVY